MLLNPVLMQLAAQAAGASSAVRKRFVFVVQCNGIDPNHVVPVGLPRRRDKELMTNDTTVATPLADHELPAPIAALTPFKDRLTIIRGLSGCIAEGGTGGHSTNHGALGCYPGSQGPMAQTIDWALGEACPGIIPCIGLGIMGKPDQTLNYNLSASAPGKAAPIQCAPEQAFKGLFGSVTGGVSRAQFDHRTSLLDFMVDDVRRARNALAGEERVALDPYLEAFAALHGRQGKIDAIKPALTAAMPKLDEKFAKPTETNRLESQFETGAAALIAGLTNVLTLTSGGGGQQYVPFPELGIPIDGHDYGHGKGVNGKTYEDCFVAVRQYHCQLIASLAAKLQSVREGDGTMLDNTLIVYLSDSGEAHHPDLKDWPVVLLGGLVGKLQPGGRYLQTPTYGAKSHRTLSNLYLTLLQAAGKPRDKFGVPDNGLRGIDQTGVINELLA
ncbi:MAG: DUF1552 domain-containing protein [Planctomycetaceae bacterium]